MCLQIKYLIYMVKEDLVLNNLQWLIYHKTQFTNQPIQCDIEKIILKL